MSTITKEFTKEQLQQIEAAAKEVMWPVVWSEKKAREHFSEKITPKVVLGLARIALESLEAEPVAWLLSGGGAKNHVSFDSGNAYADPLREVTPLYTATPAPVSVPYLLEQFAEFMAAESIKSGDYPDGWQCKASNAAHEYAQNIRAAMLKHSEPFIVTNDHRMMEMPQVEAINAVTAMLQGAGGNSPVIPDGWVACSERMPDVGVKVLCFPVNDEPIHATYNGQVWLQDISWSTSDEPIDNVISCNVFHWMPLPAAPQQEVK